MLLNQNNKVAGSELNNSNKLLAGINKGKIKSIENNIIQVPSKENNHTAICSVKVATKNKSFSDYGVATPDAVNGSTDTEELLDVASQKATQKIVQKIHCHHNSHNSQTIDAEFSITSLSSPLNIIPSNAQSTGMIKHAYVPAINKQNPEQKNYNHRSDKIISVRQKEMIEKMGSEKRVDIASIAKDRIGKELENFSSRDANDLIQILKQK